MAKKNSKLVAVPKADLNLVLQYMWADEERNYEENKPCRKHIFNVIKRLDKAAETDTTAVALLHRLCDLQECEGVDEEKTWSDVLKFLHRNLVPVRCYLGIALTAGGH